jgi:cold shock CspA family protein
LSSPAGRWPLLAGVPRIGWVAGYDAGRGLGSVTESLDAEASSPVYSFHCTAIADGSREIDPGTKVAFVLVAGLGGALEAAGVTPVGPSDD